jgi:hypothetical protein
MQLRLDEIEENGADRDPSHSQNEIPYNLLQTDISLSNS